MCLLFEFLLSSFLLFPLMYLEVNVYVYFFLHFLFYSILYVDWLCVLSANYYVSTTLLVMSVFCQWASRPLLSHTYWPAMGHVKTSFAYLKTCERAMFLSWIESMFTLNENTFTVPLNARNLLACVSYNEWYNICSEHEDMPSGLIPCEYKILSR